MLAKTSRPMFKTDQFPIGESGFVRPLFGALIVLLLIGFAFPYLIFGKVVNPDMVGVRRNYFSIAPFLEGGFEPQGLSPGLHWQIPQLSEVVLLPRGLQYINFSGVEKGGADKPAALILPTTDGSKVNADVTLIFRLFSQRGEGKNEPLPKEIEGEKNAVTEVAFAKRSVPKHGGPKELIERFKIDESQILQQVSQRATDDLLKSLSKLSTSEYYNPRLREKETLSAHQSIAQSVGRDGIDLWATLIRRYRYADNGIDDQIFAKNLQNEIERLNSASTALAKARAETEDQVAKADANIRTLEVKGQSEAQILESKARRFEAEKKAEGDLLVATARAEIETKRAEVLSQIQGADIYVARELAPLLKTLKGGVVSSLDPFDVDAWIRT